MISIIDRYLLRDITKTMLSIFVVLILILMSNNLIKILRLASEGLLSNEAIPQIIGLEILRIAPNLIPPAFFFATLYTLGRMYRDNEITALAFSGLGGWRIYRSIFFVAILTTIFVGWLSLFVYPQSALQIAKIKLKESKNIGFSQIKTAEFNEIHNGKLIFYAQKISEDGRVLKDIFIQDHQHNKVGITTAKEGYQYIEESTGDRFLVLINGHRYEGQAGEKNYTIGQFSEYAIRIQQKALDTNNFTQRKTIASSTLAASDDIKDQAHFQWRLTLPLSILVYALLSISLSKTKPRSGIYSRLFIAIFTYFIYLNVQKIAEAWMRQGKTPEWLGVWWVPVVGVLIGLFFLVRPQYQRKKLSKKRLKQAV